MTWPPTELAMLVARTLTAAFLGVLFLQSGLDKVTDRKGNLDWLTGHFAKSPLRSVVGPMLGVMTLLELAAGALSAAGAVQVVLGATTLAFYGAALSAVSILCLFFGQRVAKDYAGAGGLVPYFILTIFAVLLQQ